MRLFVSSLSNTGGYVPPEPIEDIKFYAMGDPQWRSNGDGGTRDVIELKWSIRDSVVYAENNKDGEDFMLVLGDYMDLDITQDPSQYPAMNTIMENYTDELFCIAGNHDITNNSQNNSSVVDFYNAITPTFTSIGDLHSLGYGYTQRPNGLHIIALNSSDASYSGYAVGTASDGVGGLSDTQMTWFKSALNSITGSNARLLVTIHYQMSDSSDNDYKMERTQRYEIFNFIAKWQKESDNGVCIGILNGHRHVDQEFLYTGYYGSINAYTFNDSLSDDYTGYTGSESVVSTQEQFMNYASCEFNETNRHFVINGIGLQDSYDTDLSSRITPVHVPAPDTEAPVCGTLAVSDIVRRLATLNCTATDNIGVVGFEVWYKSTGGDTSDVPLSLNRIIYAQSIDNFIIGQISSGGSIEVYVIAFDEQGNKSTKSNTVIFTGG